MIVSVHTSLPFWTGFRGFCAFYGIIVHPHLGCAAEHLAGHWQQQGGAALPRAALCCAEILWGGARQDASQQQVERIVEGHEQVREAGGHDDVAVLEPVCQAVHQRLQGSKDLGVRVGVGVGGWILDKMDCITAWV